MVEMNKIIQGIELSGRGRFSMVYEEGEWVVSLEFGSEEDDSPLYGGASYFTDCTAETCIDVVLAETGWNRWLD